MFTYSIIPLVAAMALTMLGGLALSLAPGLRANFRGGLLLLLAGFWAACEVLWNTAPDAETALFYHRLAALGFGMLGPLTLALVSEVTVRPIPHVRTILPLSCLVGIVFTGLGCSGPALVANMVKTSWGWGLLPGYLFLPWILFTAANMGYALLSFRSLSRNSAAEVDRVKGPMVAGASMLAMLLGLGTDGLMPLLGVQLPRLGTLALASFGIVVVWGLKHFGYARAPERVLAGRIIRTLPDGLMLTSLNGRISLANTKLEQLIECGPGEAASLTLSEIIDEPLLDPPREVTQLSCELHTARGRRIPVLVSSSRLVHDGGDVLGLVVIVSDQREIESLRNQVVLSDRLAAVGQLAAGIAHELNNPLAFVRTNVAVLEEDLRELRKRHHGDPAIEAALQATTEWDELLGDSLEGLDRAATIVRDIKDFSHAGRGEKERVDLSGLMDQVLRMAMPQFKGSIDVVSDYPPELLVEGQCQRLKQLFLNLIVNAGQAIEGTGTVTIRARRVKESVRIDVEDDGVGIAEEDQERIFDLFFTTKEVGVGTGLGLAISHEIVRAHGGRIWVEGRRGGGSVFHVALPVWSGGEAAGEA